LAAVCLLFTLAFAGCDALLAAKEEEEAARSTESAFSLTAPDTSVTTTRILLSFSPDIAGFSSDDIIFAPQSPFEFLSAGEPVRTGEPGVYSLPVIGFESLDPGAANSLPASGTVSITIRKAGYEISNPSAAAQVCYRGPAKTARFFVTDFNGGQGVETTTRFTLAFVPDVPGINAGDIAVLPGVTGANKGALIPTGDGVYSLELTGVGAEGAVSVTASKNGYVFEPASQTGFAYYANPNAGAALSFLNLAANGGAVATDTLGLSFGRDITGFTEGDITLADTDYTGARVKPGSLKNIGTGYYTLGIEGVGSSGNISVTVRKAGYAVVPETRYAAVAYAPPNQSPANNNVSFVEVNGDGSDRQATAAFYLLFDRDIENLAANDITVTDISSSGAAKGGLERIGAGMYRLGLTVATAGNVLVTVNRANVSPSNRFAEARTVKVSFTKLESDGEAGAATTKNLTLAFDREVDGFAPSDITFSGPGSKGARLSRKGSAAYVLPVDGVTAAGTAGVKPQKAGYEFTPALLAAPVHYAAPAAFTGLAYGTSGGTASLTLAFDRDVGLTGNDVEITSSGGTGAVKGAFDRQADGKTCTLALTGITQAGTVTVKVRKSGFEISPATRSVEVGYIVPVALNNVTANGTESTESTTMLVLDFDKAVDGLTADDITLSGMDGITKGTLVRNGAAYILPVGGITAAGTVTVAVSKNGYNISNASKTVAVHYAPVQGPATPQQVAFNNVIADGEQGKTATTKLVLDFSGVIDGLTADDIELSGMSITKGPLGAPDGATYTLPISGFTATGTLTVKVSKNGYNIGNVSKTVAVYYVQGPATPQQVEFNSVTANGTADKTSTTALTLAFSQAIDGLTADDIELSGMSGVTKGQLGRNGTTYTLPVSGFTAKGTLTVKVSRNGYTVNPESKAVDVHYAQKVEFTGLVAANGSANTVTTTALTLTFDKAIANLTKDDITLSGLSGTITKGTLSAAAGTSYTLPISGFTAAGTVTAVVSKTGYDIGNATKTAQVHIAQVAFTNLASDGTAHVTATTKLTLTLDREIAGLTKDDITLSGVSGITKETLSRSGLTYTLPISGSFAAGTVTVTVSKAGYVINTSQTAAVRTGAVPGAAGMDSIKSNVGVTSTGTAGVTETFTRLSQFIKADGLTSQSGVINLGDWIDLEGGITVNAYPSGGGFQYTGASDNTRLIVVGINSFNGKNGNNQKHVVFQFKNIPVFRRMNPTGTNENGYAASEMRQYLVPYSGSSGNFLTGLKNAGVPGGVLWGPKRSVAIRSYGTATNEIGDLLWLPTEWEMFGTRTYSPPDAETAANQARLEYYDSDTRRMKNYNANNAASEQYYWLSSLYSGTFTSFCSVSSSGSAHTGYASNALGIAPAFCVY
jgi:hypothetical protein